MSPRKLPLDLEEEILVRVPPRSLIRFRSVCKVWNTLFNDKIFANRNFAFGRPEILLKTHTHMYSISVDLNNDDLTIKVTDVRFVALRDRRRYDLVGTCDGYFFLYNSDHKGVNVNVVSNPWLRETKWITPGGTPHGKSLGYDGSSPEKSFKIFGMMNTRQNIYQITRKVAFFEFATNAWNVTHCTTPRFLEEEILVDEYHCRVSLNGNLYWTAYPYQETGHQYFIRMFDFSKEVAKTFCILPFKGKHSSSHTRGLAIYKGDRISVIQQCTRSREVKIWVTEKRIGNGDDGEDVVWIKFMTISIPHFPMVCNNSSSSYFVDDTVFGKTFVTCFLGKKPKQAWVYIVQKD
ncbi:PREDICTED: putative F-box protein At1g58090 [Camelina sativa]|uniref:F-box protein At1g58090 n=1 Tax=Camelina sativa TaxID=90675 RepID=A0ABM0T0F8_CAMSA|nr:PREDICTED: putative F-box protein At1g58090 [Camelina sativa]